MTETLVQVAHGMVHQQPRPALCAECGGRVFSSTPYAWCGFCRKYTAAQAEPCFRCESEAYGRVRELPHYMEDCVYIVDGVEARA